MLTLIEYFLFHSKKFDKASVEWTGIGTIYPNGTLTGIQRYLNRSEVDVGFPMSTIREDSKEVVDFTYPFEFQSITFITAKPKYKPQVWSIFQTISLPVWFATLLCLIIVILISYAYFWQECSADKIVLHAWAVFLRQNSILNPSSFGKKLLIFSWVIGAMFLCLAYDSVFLSFLSFPPINKITNVAELAKSVEKGEFKGLCFTGSSICSNIKKSSEPNLKIIKRSLMTVNVNYIGEYFILESRKQNLAFFCKADFSSSFTSHFFVSDDHFFERVGAIMVRKDFPSKKSLETFVHRMMASGLYFKYQNKDIFFEKVRRFLKYPEKENGNRKITLKDVAPAFIFLIAGYFVSTLVFFGELLLKKKAKA